MTLKATIVIVCACFVLGIVALYLIVSGVNTLKANKRRRAREAARRQAALVQPAPRESEPSVPRQDAKKEKRVGIFERVGTMNVILIVLFVTLLVFTIEMIKLYKETGGIPDTLCNCVFLAATGEGGFMGWIKTTKERFRERGWQKEDEKEIRERTGGGEDAETCG